MGTPDDLVKERAGLVVVKPEPFNAEAPPEGLHGEITPTALHFVRSNFALPAHEGRLEISGAVRNEMTMTLDDLRAMPAVERTVTLECAGNGRLGYAPLPAGEPWDRNAVSTARWTGALLHEVLSRTQLRADAVDVAFEGADHGPHEGHDDVPFVRALAAGQAMDPTAEVLIAYAMNGEPLSRDHGAPFRLIVPGWYGVASVKWLKRIDVLTQPFVGDFQTSRYVYEWPDRPHEPVAHTRVRARVTEPTNGGTIPAGRHTVRGKAWSGTGPVTRVEVSLSGAAEWHGAHVEPPLGPYQWQDWSFEWEATTPGRRTIRARATDAAGNVQPEVPPWNRLGYGNNAIEVCTIDVR
jgi:DMSO/TMAO reductase YedYZ molybdopterin-dependent catalytic subunit